MFFCAQYVFSLITATVLLPLGMNAGFSGVALSLLTDPTGKDLHLNANEATWFGKVQVYDNADFLKKFAVFVYWVNFL